MTTTPHCDTAVNRCVQCTSGAQCGVSTPYCSSNDKCVQCLGSGNCTGGKLCDPTSLRCVQCLATSDCAGAVNDAGVPQLFCNTSSGVCVGCLTHGDCSPSQPICTTASQCVQCLVNSQCGDAGSGICNTTAMTCSIPCATLNACCPVLSVVSTSLMNQCVSTASGGMDVACTNLLGTIRGLGICP